ncbi:hypothetical protein BU15DRAFT_60130 [Melanogaster broomeanus]|nr:hypothetical protein BU15DRAFT_60130 [Melanogaster broomeanus]
MFRNTASNVDAAASIYPTTTTTKGKGKEKEPSLPPPEASGAGRTFLDASAADAPTSIDPNAPSEEVPALDPSTVNPDQWPFEPFPSPPPDGYWLPKCGPPPPSKFPNHLSNVPSTSTYSLPLVPPLMPLTYPPPPPLSETDPTWLFQMMGDVMRHRSHLELGVAEAQAEVTNAHLEGGLAEAELEEEMDNMQEFLNTVARVAGNGFIRRMLKDVDASIKEMIGNVTNDDEDRDAQKENADRNDGGMRSMWRSIFTKAIVIVYTASARDYGFLGWRNSQEYIHTHTKRVFQQLTLAIVTFRISRQMLKRSVVSVLIFTIVVIKLLSVHVKLVKLVRSLGPVQRPVPLTACVVLSGAFFCFKLLVEISWAVYYLIMLCKNPTVKDTLGSLFGLLRLLDWK